MDTHTYTYTYNTHILIDVCVRVSVCMCVCECTYITGTVVRMLWSRKGELKILFRISEQGGR